MKLRAITLENVRRFTDPVRIDGISDGLNILSEPNEFGKSTVFDAIQALFFKPHGSRDREIAALRPHAGGAPQITIEVETDAGRFVIAKRWFSKPTATVHQSGRLIAQSDEAEAWIADLLGGGEGGPSGLIWVRQGLTDLATGSKKELDLALEARRDLMTSVGEALEEMTGGRRMDMALARCREELDGYATGRNRTLRCNRRHAPCMMPCPNAPAPAVRWPNSMHPKRCRTARKSLSRRATPIALPNATPKRWNVWCAGSNAPRPR